MVLCGKCSTICIQETSGRTDFLQAFPHPGEGVRGRDPQCLLTCLSIFNERVVCELPPFSASCSGSASPSAQPEPYSGLQGPAWSVAPPLHMPCRVSLGCAVLRSARTSLPQVFLPSAPSWLRSLAPFSLACSFCPESTASLCGSSY